VERLNASHEELGEGENSAELHWMEKQVQVLQRRQETVHLSLRNYSRSMGLQKAKSSIHFVSEMDINLGPRKHTWIGSSC
jgi:hypothetical protein